MAKIGGGSNILVEKGEKIGLGIATVLGVLFLAFGVMAMFNRPQDPDAFSKALEQKASGLNSQMGGPATPIEDIKDPLKTPVSGRPVAFTEIKNPYFDPTPVPDNRRITPTVLPVEEGVVDIAVLKILANDFILERNESGEVVKVRVGVITARTDEKVEGGGKFVGQVKGRFGRGKIPPKAKGPGMGGFPGGEGFPGGPGAGGAGSMRGGGGMGGFPGGPGPGGMGGYPGGPGMGGMGGYPGGPGPGGMGGYPGGPGFGGGPGPGGMGGFPGGMGGFPGGGGMRGGGGFTGSPDGGGADGLFTGSGTAGRREAVEYIEGADDEAIEAQLKGRRLAITIKPQRMTVIQGSFPYRAQLEKFRQALRLQKIEELYSSDDMPVFAGVDVQRRTYRPRNQGRDLDILDDWTSIDLAGNSQDLRAVRLYYNEDLPDLQRVMLHEDHMLVMPLPHEMPGAGKYPDHTKLKTLMASIDKMKKADPRSILPPPSKKRFQGLDNPFKKDESAVNPGLYNLGGGEGSPGIGFPTGPRGGKNPADAGLPVGTASAYQPPDHVYVRVYDTDIKDGLVYEYRIRVKLKNPNFKKHDLVSKKSDADMEELPPQEDHWFEIKQKVSVPQGGYTYVTEWTQPKANESRPLPRPEFGQAVLQFQRWYEYLDLPGALKEPVGDWVMSELMATRGQFVTGKAFAPVPFWSSVDNAFVLREIPGEKTAKGRDPRRGAIIDPVRPKALLAVDVAGGRVTVKVQPNPGEKTNRLPTTSDESAPEVLFMYPDGSMEVKSSARDKADTDRKEREEHFKKWVDDTAQRNPSTAPPAKKKDDF